MEQHKKSYRSVIVAFIILIVGLGAGAIILQLVHRTSPKPATTVQTQTHQPAPITYRGIKGKTALAQLKEQAQVATKTSQYGEYVDSINGVKGGTHGKYWSFYVNGTLATVGAGAYTATGGETITWKFE